MKIQVNGTQTIVQQIPVDIRLHDAADAVCVALLRKIGIPAGSYLQKGKIVTWDSGRGGSGITTVEIEHPTPEQLHVLDTCSKLMKLVSVVDRAL